MGRIKPISFAGRQLPSLLSPLKNRGGLFHVTTQPNLERETKRDRNRKPNPIRDGDRDRDRDRERKKSYIVRSTEEAWFRLDWSVRGGGLQDPFPLPLLRQSPRFDSFLIPISWRKNPRNWSLFWETLGSDLLFFVYFVFVCWLIEWAMRIDLFSCFPG